MVKRIRLDKLLSSMGYGSRAEIRRIVRTGIVTVDGSVEKDSGRIVDPGAEQVRYDGELVEYRDKIYLVMNKPPGVISATEDSRDRTVIDLLDPRDRVLEPFPVGRLDKDTEGLLLLTNDGQLAHDLLSPRKHVPKTYYALVEGDTPVGENDREQFAKGVTLEDGYTTLPAELAIEGIAEPEAGGSTGVTTRVRLTIHEGKFHQVKRMFLSTGRKVTYLQRVSMGSLVLDGTLGPGEYRELTAAELEGLRNASSNEDGKD
ncbi:pseudouridine synthase [Paenibacillus sp. D9]|uniref:pseudouridine synthase n=1 Tax=Paenibacillus TaxID=44249 RepID=UPI00061E4728|nr:pseudouridine synthase [Paenibacillus sp. D9]KKC45991.1 RNA pseudouridine synthase [Paenibacillus sp. D9]